MNSLLVQLADELLVLDITEPGTVLGSLSDHELQAVYDYVLDQFSRTSDRHSRKLRLVL
ncbi:MAG: hypothetical protein ABJF23_31520 [Bryobacteraceae bacterium]